MSKGRRKVVVAFLSQPTAKRQHGFNGVCIFGLDAGTRRNDRCFSVLHKSDDVSPIKTAIDQFEALTNLTYNSHFLQVRSGAPFSLIEPGSENNTATTTTTTYADVHPFLFTINPQTDSKNDLNLNFIPLPRLAELDPTGILWKALDRCTVSASLDATLTKLRSDNVSGAGHLANLAVEELANLCHDPELLSVYDFEGWWQKLRLYGWHIANNSRPSMAAAMKTCLVRTLGNILGARDRLSALAGIERADSAKEIVLDTLKKIRILGRSIPGKFKDFITSCDDVWISERRAPLTFLLHSSSSVVASSLTQLFPLYDRPSIRMFVLESRPLYEGVAFARFFKSRIEEIPQKLQVPPVTVEIAVDAAASVYSRAADVFLLAADRIYPNGDVSNKIGCLSAVLAMRHHAGCNRRKVIVIGTTDKICATDEREKGWDYSYEETDGAQITDAWPHDVRGGGGDDDLRVRNMLFETVPGDLIDCYVTEFGVIDRNRIGEIAKEHLEKEKGIFAGL